MADNTVDSCLNKNPRNTYRGSKKKFCGYHYVPPESDEADTLKDKFWRDLEQGKLNFLNTVDMYTRVKRLGKLSEVDCFTVSNQDPILLSNTSPVTSLQSSSMPSSSATGSLISARDASPPSSSGYESSSIPSIGSASVTDSPTECDQHVGDLFINVAQSERSVLKRKRKTSSNCVWQSTVKSKRRKHQTADRNPSDRKKTTNRKFFRYVDASSKEADTLKDKFWRDLELKNVSAITTTDLYSSVKVSRRTRQLSFSSVRKSDLENGCTKVPATNEESQASKTFEGTGVSDISVRCCEADASSCNRNNDESTLDQPSDFCISDQMLSVADCKLLSPCSVSVERLSFNFDDVAGTAETCCSVVGENSSCINAETVSNLITENHGVVPLDMLINLDNKRFWHSGRCRAGWRHLNKDKCISGSNIHAKRVHLTSFEINRSIPLCHVPLAFPSTCQQRVICGWIEDDAITKAGEVLLCPRLVFSSSILLNRQRLFQY